MLGSASWVRSESLHDNARKKEIRLFILTKQKSRAVLFMGIHRLEHLQADAARIMRAMQGVSDPHVIYC